MAWRLTQPQIALFFTLIYKDSALSIFMVKWLDVLRHLEVQEFKSLKKLLAQYHRLGNKYNLPKQSAHLLDILQQWSATLWEEGQMKRKNVCGTHYN